MSDEHDANISKMLMQPVRAKPNSHQDAGKWRFSSAARFGTAAGGIPLRRLERQVPSKLEPRESRKLMLPVRSRTGGQQEKGSFHASALPFSYRAASPVLRPAPVGVVGRVHPYTRWCAVGIRPGLS